MKNCTDCRHADWQRTANGRLHPSGEGMCRFPVVLPTLPASRHWWGESPPVPAGGYINRHKELKNHCPCFERGPFKEPNA